MPELPEVETTCRGVAPHICRRRIEQVVIRNRHLRQPVTRGLARILEGREISEVVRRGKYLLLGAGDGTLLVHLGMSGSLRIVDSQLEAQKHDHVDIVFSDDVVLRYRDPRRFGLVLWIKGDPYQHALLHHLGPEPLSTEFDARRLFDRSRGRRLAVKQFIMDGTVVVGVGNIYASEALFGAGIHPQRPAGRISLLRYQKLVEEIRRVLTDAIHQGGTTLRDFVGGDGNPGYFSQRLNVYGRDGQPCLRCGSGIRLLRQGQRSGYYCPRCQR